MGGLLFHRKRGEYDNEALIAEILELRDRKAHLLGYGCFADYATSRRMAGSGANALKFINDLHDKVKPSFLKDMEAVRRYKEEKTGKPVEKLSPWETGYWSEKRRRELYAFDEEDLRPYYSVEKVMEGLFSIYSGLYGITVTPRPTVAFKPGESGKRRKARWRYGIRTSCSMNCMMRKAGSTWVPFTRTGIRGTPSAPGHG